MLVEASEAMAPGWERRRARIDGAARAGARVAGARAGAGARGHGAGARRRLGRHRPRRGRGRGRGRPPHRDRPDAGDGGDRSPARGRGRRPQRRAPGHGRRAHRPARRVGGRRALPLRPTCSWPTRRRPWPGRAGCCGRADGSRSSVWGPPERNPWLAIGGAALRERGHVPPPAPGEPSPVRAWRARSASSACLARRGPRGGARRGGAGRDQPTGTPPTTSRSWPTRRRRGASSADLPAGEREGLERGPGGRHGAVRRRPTGSTCRAWRSARSPARLDPPRGGLLQ